MNKPDALPYPHEAIAATRANPKVSTRDWRTLPPLPDQAMFDRWLNERPFVPTAEDCEAALGLVQLLTENAAHGDPFAIWLLNEIDRAGAALAAVS